MTDAQGRLFPEMATGPRLRPMFSFFGSKWRLAPHYPPPKHDLIIEPFAGSSAYALTYPDREVLLIDRDASVIATWRYLLAASPADIMSLPDRVEHVDEVPAEARAFVGFWLAKGTTTPQVTATAWARKWWTEDRALVWGPAVKRRVATQLPSIRHWQVLEGDYSEAPDLKAAWFIDPPYAVAAGRHYRHNAIDYGALGSWCRARRGQVIVCEDSTSTWLPFRPLRGTKGTRRDSMDAVYLQDGA